MRKMKLFVIMSILALVTACSGNESKKDTTTKPIVISGKNWTEQYILSQLLAIYIEKNTDYKVDLQDGLGEVSILTPALEKGQIDMYVEYTGTGLEAVLNEQAETGESSESILNRVKKGYEDKYKATWLKPLGFENNYTLAYSDKASFQATTYSNIAALSANLSFGAPHAFYERQGDGYDAFAKAYNFQFTKKESFDPNVMYEAVAKGEVDVIPAFTTDGRIQRYNLQTTTDDLGFFPHYDAAIVIRQEVLKQYPKLEETLNGLAGKISEADMQQMNAKVDIDKQDYKTVATEFLKAKELIK